MKRSLWPFGMLAVLVSLALSTVLVFVSPSRYIVASIDGDHFVDETTALLALESKIYVLHPNVLLQRTLNELDWIEAYTITRTLPNQVSIDYQIKLPIACSPGTVYYSIATFARSERHEALCASAIQFTGLVSDEAHQSLRQLPMDIRNLIQRIEFQDQQALVTMKNGQQAIVDPIDFRVLQSIARLAPTGTVLDLRRNYA